MSKYVSSLEQAIYLSINDCLRNKGLKSFKSITFPSCIIILNGMNLSTPLPDNTQELNLFNHKYDFIAKIHYSFVQKHFMTEILLQDISNFYDGRIKKGEYTTHQRSKKWFSPWAYFYVGTGFSLSQSQLNVLLLFY